MPEAASAPAGTRVQHLVLFRFREEPGPDVEEEMRRQIAAWAGAVPGLRRLRFGRDVGGRADGYQFGLLTEFVDQAALQAYLGHPLHLPFLAWVTARPIDVLRFDYALTAETGLLEPPEA